MNVSTFRTDQPALAELLNEVACGRIQLPDFQRGWVWDDNHIRSLIASVTLSYPIGAVMLMETGGQGVRFKPRMVEGAELPHPPNPDKLILDGQQRLTSLFLALKSGLPVETHTEKGKKVFRLYYLDMAKCLDPDVDREDAVVSISEKKVLTSNFGRDVELDLRTSESEYEARMFPLALAFDPTASNVWENAYRKYYKYEENALKFVDSFRTEILMGFHQYKIPVIVLLRDTPKDAVCKVFEKVNTGGVSLSVFELVTATFASDDFSLRDDWKARKKRLHEKTSPIKALDSTDFLTAATLMTTYEAHVAGLGAVGCKRKDILDKLTLDRYRSVADRLETGLLKAGRFLIREKVFDERNLPYKTQVVPLAVMCALLGDRFEDEGVKSKLSRWYWCGVFGEMYGGSTEARFAFDVPEVLRWLDGDAEPRTIRDSSFSAFRLLTLQSRQSAAYKGLATLLLRAGSRDFLNGDEIGLTNYFDEAVDIHHIFPKHYCEAQKYHRLRWNSVVNKAPLSARTNRAVGGQAPSIYLNNLLQKHSLSREQLEAHLRSHQIEPRHMWDDDFNAFLHHRALRLLDLIEKVTGKNVTGREEEDVIREFGAALTEEAELERVGGG